MLFDLGICSLPYPSAKRVGFAGGRRRDEILDGRPPRDFWPKKASRRRHKWKEATGVLREGFGSPCTYIAYIMQNYVTKSCYISKFAQFYIWQKTKPKWEISQASCG